MQTKTNREEKAKGPRRVMNDYVLTEDESGEEIRVGETSTAFPGRRTRTRGDSRARCATAADVRTAWRAEAKTSS